MAVNIVVRKDGCVALKHFKKVLDISKAAYYSLEYNEKDGTIELKFYDSKKKVIKPYMCAE
jgi:hypothetical protein